MKKITIIGGDCRLKAVKKHLEERNYEVDTLGLYENDNGDFTSSKFIILPVPSTTDCRTVFTPLTHRQILLSEIEQKTNDEQLILCCNYKFETKKYINYGMLDSYSLLNAVPTAEGAIKLAIENTPFTLWNSRVLVIGYGRVGRVLAERLKALKCKVTVSARKPADFAMIDVLGYQSIHTENLNFSPLDYDIIFNTVDVKVIDNSSLASCGAALMVDLSSKGGFDISTAAKYGITAIKAPGLPGMIAPKTAGEILAKTVTDLINSYN